MLSSSLSVCDGVPTTGRCSDEIGGVNVADEPLRFMADDSSGELATSCSSSALLGLVSWPMALRFFLRRNLVVVLVVELHSRSEGEIVHSEELSGLEMRRIQLTQSLDNRPSRASPSNIHVADTEKASRGEYVKHISVFITNPQQPLSCTKL